MRPLPGRADRLRLPDVQPAGGLHGLGKRDAVDAVRPRAAGQASGAALAGPRGPEPPHDPSAGQAIGGRAAAGGRGPGPGQQAAVAAGRRADGQRRRRPPAADPRLDPRDVPGGKRGPDHRDSLQRSGRAVLAWIGWKSSTVAKQGSGWGLGIETMSRLDAIRNRNATDP